MRNIIALGLLATISLLTGQAQAIPLDAGNDSYPYPTTYPDFSYPNFDGGIILFPPYYDGGIGVPELMDAGAPPVPTTEEPPLALDAGSSSAAPISSAAPPDTSAAVTSGGPGTSGPNETEEPVTEPSGETGSTTGDGSNTSVGAETSSEAIGGGTGAIDAGSTDEGTIPAETSSPAPNGTVTSDESPTSGNEGNDTSEAPGNDTSEAPGNDTSGDDNDGTTEDDDLPTVVADAGVDAGGVVDGGSSDDGCDCRVAGGPQTNASKFGGLAFAGLAFIAMGRRRQRRA